MSGISFSIVSPDDSTNIHLIAEWYLEEWNIPIQTTINKLQSFTEDQKQFQILAKLDHTPIATGGIHHHVSLLEREPRFRIYQNWLALIYTLPAFRHKGYGTMLCEQIDKIAIKKELKEIFLYTHTAESLYKRLNWKELERIQVGDKNIVVMKKAIACF